MKKPNKKTLKLKCDNAVRDIVKLKGKCEKCGRSDTQMHVHHIIGRRNLHLRHDLRNLIYLCCYCHKLSKNSAHENPLEFMDWLDATKPEDLNYLRKEQYVLETNYDYESKLEELKKL